MSSVVGFDFGNSTCYVAVVKTGGIETIANSLSDRLTPSFISFTKDRRFSGSVAKMQLITNIQNTVHNFKNLIGLKFSDPEAQEQMAFEPDRFCKLDKDEIGVKVSYLGQQTTFTMVQIAAMVLTELKDIAETDLKMKVHDCVINVPFFYTEGQRKCILAASKVAGLNCLRLLNDTCAVALNYALFKSGLPEINDKPLNVCFVDVGNSCTQISIVKFNNGRMEVTGVSGSSKLGGRNIDLAIADYMCETFKTKYNIDSKSRKKSWTKLLVECETLKKRLSSCNMELGLSIECFMDDIDVSHKMDRDKLNELISSMAKHLEELLNEAVKTANLTVEDISFVEIVGGSTRVPLLKDQIKTFFNKEVSTTMNADEACARGCAIMCALMSPKIRVKHIDVFDQIYHPIKVFWEKNDKTKGEMVVFDKKSPFPTSKVLTLLKKDSLCVEAFQCLSDSKLLALGVYKVNIPPTEDSNLQDDKKIRVKLHLNHNSLFVIENVTMTCIEKKNNDSKPTEMTEDESKVKNEQVESQATKAETNSSQQPSENKKMKSQELVVDSTIHSCTLLSVDEMFSAENEMLHQIKTETEKSDAKNALEEYIYHINCKFETDYKEFVTKEELEKIMSESETANSWLFEFKENETKQLYNDKLNHLKQFTKPVVDRFNAFDSIPKAFDSFGQSVVKIRKAIDTLPKDSTHITNQEIDHLVNVVNEKSSWMYNHLDSFKKLPKHTTPSITVDMIFNEQKNMENECVPIIKKPKPAPAPSPKKEGANAPETTPKDVNINEAEDKQSETPQNADAKQDDIDMAQ